MSTTGLPTLSQIQGWDVEHLVAAADHWTSTADQWENVFGQVWQQSLAMSWEGQAAEALHERTSTDKMTATGKADQLREASTIARRGAGDIDSAKRRALYAIEDAHNAGFSVGEDLSVSDTQTSRTTAERAARQAQAQVFAADIRHRAAALVGVDDEVGANLTQTAGDVGNTTFTEKPINYDGKPIQVDANPRNGTIQLVGHGFKQDGGTTPSPLPQPSPSQGQPQIGPFPVPPEVAAAAPQQAPPQAAPPPAAPAPSAPPGPGFGQCVGQQFHDNIGKNMVKDGFKSGITTAIKGFIAGGAGGAVVTPEAGGAGAIPGALGGTVLGFVGGFAKGLLEAPVKTAAEGALDCLK